MGGCCCSSRKPQLHGTPVYYYCPPALEERESLTSHDSAAVSLTAGLFVDLNLDASIPDTYRAPPAPIPFDVVLVCPHDSESGGETVSESSYQKTCNVNLKQPDCKVQTGAFLASPRKCEVEFSATNGPKVSTTEEEDVCPTCLEEYDAENPRITTKCNHQFHFSCILEWMERSDTCPICNKEMDFEAL